MKSITIVTLAVVNARLELSPEAAAIEHDRKVNKVLKEHIHQDPVFSAQVLGGKLIYITNVLVNIKF